MRPGRIDLKAEFKKPNKDVASKYFLTFYPGAEEAAVAFGTSVGGRIAERKASWLFGRLFGRLFAPESLVMMVLEGIRGQVSMAQLQHFFLACHRQGFDAAKAPLHNGLEHVSRRPRSTSATLCSMSQDPLCSPLTDEVSLRRSWCEPLHACLGGERWRQAQERPESIRERMGSLRSTLRQRLQKTEERFSSGQ